MVWIFIIISIIVAIFISSDDGDDSSNDGESGNSAWREYIRMRSFFDNSKIYFVAWRF